MNFTLFSGFCFFLVAGCCFCTGIFDDFKGEFSLEFLQSFPEISPRGRQVLIYGPLRRNLPAYVVEHVIDRGTFNVNAIDIMGLSSLYYALRDKNFEAAQVLIDHGADLSTLGAFLTADLSAGALRFLLRSGFDLCELQGLLSECILNSNFEAADCLLEYNSDFVNLPTLWKRTPLIAVYARSGLKSEADDVLALRLMSAGAVIDAVDSKGRNVLYYAMEGPKLQKGTLTITPKLVKRVILLVNCAGTKSHQMLNQAPLDNPKLTPLVLMLRKKDVAGKTFLQVMLEMEDLPCSEVFLKEIEAFNTSK